MSVNGSTESIVQGGPESLLIVGAPVEVATEGMSMVDQVQDSERKFVAVEPGMSNRQVADYFLAGTTDAEKIEDLSSLAENLVLELTLAADRVDDNTMRAMVVLIRSKTALGLDASSVNTKAARTIDWALSAFCRHSRGLVCKLVAPYANHTGLDVDDLVSVGSMGLLKAMGRFDLAAEQTNQVTTFASSLVIGAAKDEIRRYEHSRRKVQANKISLDEPDQHGRVMQLPDDTADVERITHGLMYGECEDIIAGLPAKQQAIVHMRFRDGVPQNEIAAIFGVHESYVSRVIGTVVQRGRQRLGVS